MVFNSYTFLLLLLPLTLLGFHLVSKHSLRGGFAWLVITSLVYYGWWVPDREEGWQPDYLILIVGSCVANYLFGRYLAGHKGSRKGKGMLTLGVVANLALLGCYKYSGLFARTFALFTGEEMSIPDIILPLGISFFTFQQVAYLVDAFRGETEEYHFTDYLLFVTFFPQLIAGPIVHHREMLPQFESRTIGERKWLHYSAGLTILAIGLFKKVVIADNLAPIATRLFTLAASGERDLTMAEAWTAAITYALQIYFDFSGYSDMAIGAARLFGIRLPVNFHSPYKTTSITDFWRCWHITLSRFLRDYLYIPLGGNRKGPSRRYVNLFLTMLLGGIWHGAGWTFVMWGALHGTYLCLNHAWLGLRKKLAWPALPKPLAIAVTFLAVLVGWVFFRAHDFASASRMLASMAGLNGFDGWPDKVARVVASAEPLKLLPALIGVWLFPNTQEIFARYRPALRVKGAPFPAAGTRRWWQWRPTPAFAIATVLLAVATGLQFDKISEFIYFQF
jgi:D-alanyl-lipoteichoic acid acyltransferase DltB (MBOAT superfamily)